MIVDYTAGKILLILFMLVCAAEDMKHKKISLPVFMAMLYCEISGYFLVLISGGGMDYLSVFTGMLPGILLLIVSRLSNGSIGTGDGLYFVLTGICLGGAANTLLLLISMFFAGLYGVCAYVFKGCRYRKSTFAFIPLTVPAGIFVVLTEL